VRQEAVDALAADAPTYLGTSHRRPPVKNVVADIRAGLTELYALPDGYEVVLGVGGTTVFWDAAIFGLIIHRSQHTTYGEFSAKFATAVTGAPHLASPDVREAEPASASVPDPSVDVDTFALIHNETSTGVMVQIARPLRPNTLVLVDATSAAGAVTVDPTAFDAYYFAPQKAFGSDGGLWLALLSPAAIDRIADLNASRWSPPSIALQIAVDNSRLNQTYNTPALATLFLLRDQLRWMADQGGLAWAAARSRRSAAHLYGWAERSEVATPFVTDVALRSTTTVTIDLDPAVDADAVAALLAANGIFDIGGYRKLGRNQLRIATFPAIDPGDIERLTGAIEFVMHRLHRTSS